MPLLDHFHPPLDVTRPWEGFHASWTTKISEQLNAGVLPPEYVAIPQVTVGGQLEVDVGTFEEQGVIQAANGPVATAVWSPPKPLLTAPLDFVPQDVYEVQVLQELGGSKLRAAIEIVSPGNKDRPSARQAFAIKCAGYLQRGIAVVIIDVVTKRSANFHAELAELLHLPQEFAWRSATGLYAAAYRLVPAKEKTEVLAWPETLQLGAVLPTMPLWLDAELCVPLRLEASYLATCSILRIAV